MSQQKFLQTFEKIIKENCLYIPNSKREYYDFEFSWYKIYINTYKDGSIYEWSISKDGKTLINSKFDGKRIFSIIKDKIEENFDKYMENEFDKLAEELERKSWWEMSQEFQDAKRLREIAKEAQEIHSKYSKKFFWLF